MSFLVTRPPVPVPGISAIFTPCSSARRRTTGEERVRRRVSAFSISPRPSPSLSARATARCLSVPCAAGWASVPAAGNSSVGASAATFSCGGGIALVADESDLGPHVDRRAFRDEELLDLARHGRRQLGVDLVRIHLGQGLIYLHFVAF